MFFQNYYNYYYSTTLPPVSTATSDSTATTMAPEVTFAEMVDAAEVEEVSVPAAQAPRFECASL